MTVIKRHITHIKSKVLESGSPKLPLASDLLEGEIAVNYADGYETLSIKTSSGNIATFSSDTIRKKQNKVIAASLNDLNERKLDTSAYTESIGNYYTKSETSGSSEIAAALEDTTNSINDLSAQTRVVAAAFADLDERTSGIQESIDDLSGQSKTIAVALEYLNNKSNNKVDTSGFTSYSADTLSMIDDLSGQTRVVAAAFADLDERTDDLSGQTETIAAALVYLDDKTNNIETRIEEILTSIEQILSGI